MRRLFTVISFFILLFPGAFAQSGKGNVAFIEPLRPAYWLYNKSSKTTLLYFKTSSRELLYSRRESSDNVAKIKMAYRVWAADNTKEIVDSGEVYLMDVNNNYQYKQISGNIELRLPAERNYKLKIEFRDLRRNISVTDYLFISKKSKIHRQNFYMTSVNEKEMYYSQYIFAETVRVHSALNTAKKVQVRVYKRDFGLSPPPFSDYKMQGYSYSADSVYSASINDSGYVDLKMPLVGFIHVVVDTSQREGLTLFSSSRYFPRIASVEDLIAPLRFLCSSDEYKRLTGAIDKKLAVDRFWLDKTGSHDRGRDLIRNYYGRAEYANKNYSSYTEGWKTDRGMIYLIFGEPTNIDHAADSETWIYGDRFSSSSLRFNFMKVENPFTDNDYFLQRLPNYKPEWYRAVDSWRLGKVYNFVN